MRTLSAVQGDRGPAGRVTRGLIPALSRSTIARPRLVESILDTAPGAVVLMTAPYGFGATTCAGQVARVVHGAVAWIDAALADFGPDAVLGATQAPDVAWYVVDGINPGLHPQHAATVQSIVESLGDGRLLVTSHDPTWVPQVAPAKLLRMDARALAFDDDEALKLILELQPAIDPDEVRRLVVEAAGWPLALIQALHHARASSTSAASDWLMREGAESLLLPWLRSLPTSARSLLEATAVIDRLTPALCDAITGRSDAAEWLAWLSTDHGFVRELAGNDREWFECHPLLLRALRRQLRGVDHTATHAAAAAWLAGGPHVDAQIHHLIEAGRADDAAALLLDYEEALLEEGAADRVIRWYSQLPESAMGSPAERLLRIGWGRALSGDREGARLAAEQLSSVIDARRSHVSVEDGLWLDGELSLLRAYASALAGDPVDTARYARRAMEDMPGDPSRNSVQLAPLMLVRGLLWSGDVRGAQRELDRLSTRSCATDFLRESVLTGLRSQILASQGRIREAALLAHRAAGWHASQSLPLIHPSSLTAAVAYAHAEAECARLDDAAGFMADIVQAARDRQMIGEAVYASSLLARTELVLGRTRSALGVLTQARTLLQASAPGSALGAALSSIEAEVRIRLGDVMRADRIISALPASDERAVLKAWLGVLRQPASVPRVLSSLDPDTPRLAARVQVLLALDALRRSTRLAEIHVLRAGDIAEEFGMELVLADSPEPLLGLAEAAARRAGHDSLLRNALMIRALRARDRQRVAESGSRPALSRGEIELLSLLRGRDSNAEIAATLGVSRNTIKTRLSRLYRKVGVTSRDELLKVALDSGLLT